MLETRGQGLWGANARSSSEVLWVKAEGHTDFLGKDQWKFGGQREIWVLFGRFEGNLDVFGGRNNGVSGFSGGCQKEAVGKDCVHWWVHSGAQRGLWGPVQEARGEPWDSLDEDQGL